MSISIWLEVPPESRTTFKEFLPATLARLAGEVWEILPQPFVTVTVTLTKSTGQNVAIWLTRTNWAGNWWVDFPIPLETGRYLARASWDPPIGPVEYSSVLDFTSATSPISVGPYVQSDVYPNPAVVYQVVKATCQVLFDGLPESNVPASIWVWNPNDVPLVSEPSLLTDERGVVFVTFTPGIVGQYRVVVYVGKYNYSKLHWLTVSTKPAPQPPPSPGDGGGWLDTVRRYIVPAGLIAAGLFVLTSALRRRTP